MLYSVSSAPQDAKRAQLAHALRSVVLFCLLFAVCCLLFAVCCLLFAVEKHNSVPHHCQGLLRVHPLVYITQHIVNYIAFFPNSHNILFFMPLTILSSLPHVNISYESRQLFIHHNNACIFFSTFSTSSWRYWCTFPHPLYHLFFILIRCKAFYCITDCLYPGLIFFQFICNLPYFFPFSKL